MLVTNIEYYLVFKLKSKSSSEKKILGFKKRNILFDSLSKNV